MKNVSVLVVVAALAACSSVDLQAVENDLSAVRTVDVTARTLAAVPAGGQFVLDFAAGGTIYSLDPTAGSLDFDKIAVRTREGEDSCWPWLRENVPAELAYNPATDVLMVGLVEDFRAYWPPPQPRAAIGFNCNPQYCDCSGPADCLDMLFSPVCGEWFDCTGRSGVWRCICERAPRF
jgi:hypothetical protein